MQFQDIVNAASSYLDAANVFVHTPQGLYLIGMTVFCLLVTAKGISEIVKMRRGYKVALVHEDGVKVRPAVSSAKRISESEMQAARERFAAQLAQDLGQPSKRMTVVAAYADGKADFTVNVRVNVYEWNKQKLNGKTFDELTKLVATKFEGIPVQVVIEEPAKA